MPVLELRDPRRIEQHLRRRAGLHVYELGDLDPFFWPATRWFATETDDEIAALCLLYGSPAGTTLLALCAEADLPAMRALVREASPAWPSRLYAHLSPGVLAAFPTAWTSEPRGLHVKMQLVDLAAVGRVETAGIVRLGPADRGSLEAFYRAHYPGNWFDPRALETERYVGLVRDGRLSAVAGVHVFSKHMRVAALGNIAVARELRGQGLGRLITAAICKELVGDVEVVGLNVDAENEPAIRCYAGLGFKKIDVYEEHVLRRDALAGDT